MSNQFLNAHVKKYNERCSNAETNSLKTLELKERFIKSRKYKMFIELYSIFSESELLKGFELIGSDRNP